MMKAGGRMLVLIDWCSGDTTPCKVTPVILHGVVYDVYMCLERPSGDLPPEVQAGRSAPDAGEWDISLRGQ